MIFVKTAPTTATQKYFGIMLRDQVKDSQNSQILKFYVLHIQL